MNRICSPAYQFFLILCLSTFGAQSCALYQDRERCNEKERREHPNLCGVMDKAAENPKVLAEEMKGWADAVGFTVKISDEDKARIEKNGKYSSKNLRMVSSEGSLPTVLAHGMGDSCFNSGMNSITKATATLTKTDATCIPIGDNAHDDTMNSYLLNMDASVEIFAQQVKANPNLSNGFNAIGFSQGNNVIRGYIAKHNDPPVKAFISINGVNAGIGAVSYCVPKEIEITKDSVQAEKSDIWRSRILTDEDVLHSSKMCNMLMEVASKKAYSEFAQKHSFQANYWRDPRPEEKENYEKFSQLARWNNEGDIVNPLLKQNYAKTEKFVWVMANKDRIVWPKEGEQWGAPDPNGPFDHSILSMKDTEWYQKDLFGLKTADEAGKNFFESFEGDHLRFSMSQYENWITKYF